MSTSNPPTWKAVYTVIESSGRSERPLWLRIGTAFVNRDGSLNVKLNALPVNGTLHIRDVDQKEPEPSDTTGLRPVPHVSAVFGQSREPAAPAA